MAMQVSGHVRSCVPLAHWTSPSNKLYGVTFTSNMKATVLHGSCPSFSKMMMQAGSSPPFSEMIIPLWRPK